jgi:hypothetical protein
VHATQPDGPHCVPTAHIELVHGVPVELELAAVVVDELVAVVVPDVDDTVTAGFFMSELELDVVPPPAPPVPIPGAALQAVRSKRPERRETPMA